MRLENKPRGGQKIVVMGVVLYLLHPLMPGNPDGIWYAVKDGEIKPIKVRRTAEGEWVLVGE